MKSKARNGSNASRRGGASEVPAELGVEAAKDIAASLNTLLADMFTLYMKTKNFHWHMSGPHFRDYHLLLDEQAAAIYSTTDVIAERVRKVGGKTLRSIGDIAQRQRLRDNDEENVPPDQMLGELRQDNLRLAEFLREAHATCEEQGDVATTSLLEIWIDQAELRVWFLSEACLPVSGTAGRH